MLTWVGLVTDSYLAKYEILVLLTVFSDIFFKSNCRLMISISLRAVMEDILEFFKGVSRR